MFTIDIKRLPPLTSLSAFEAAARLGSFAEAADELNLTRGAISRQIKSLEDHVGVELFERRKRRVLLNESGRVLADRVRETLFILMVVADKGGAAAASRDYVLTVSVLPSVASLWLAPKLEEFAKAHPNIGLNIVTPSHEFAFDKQMVDAALHVGGQTWPDVVAHELAQAEWVAVASPNYIENHAIARVQDVLRCTLLVSASRPSAWTAWSEANHVPSTVVFLPKFKFEYFDSLIAAAINNLGVGLVPRLLIEQHLDQGRLHVIPSIAINPTAPFYFVYPKYRTTWYPLVQFRDWLLCKAGARDGVVIGDSPATMEEER